MALEEADQPAHGEGRGEGGHREAQQHRTCAQRLEERLPLSLLRGEQVLRELEGAGRAERRDPQQERELGGGGRAQAEQDAARDRHHRARGARPHRDALEESDGEGVAVAQRLDAAARVRIAAPVEPDHPHAAHEQREEHRPRGEEVLLDRVVEQGSEERRGKEGRCHVEQQAPAGGVAPHEAPEHLRDARPVEAEHGENRPALDRDLEGGERLAALGALESQQPGREDQMPRRRDGQELGHALDEAEDDGLPPLHASPPRAFGTASAPRSPPPGGRFDGLG